MHMRGPCRHRGYQGAAGGVWQSKDAQGARGGGGHWQGIVDGGGGSWGWGLGGWVQVWLWEGGCPGGCGAAWQCRGGWGCHEETDKLLKLMRRWQRAEGRGEGGRGK